MIFAQNQRQAARELARVIRKGGRLSLAAWPPDGAVQKFLAVIAKHSGAPPAEVSPLAWGDPRHAAELLGQEFEISFERGVNNAYHPDPDHIWEKYAHGFGPMRQLISGLPADRLAALRTDVDAYHRAFATAAGLHVKREYVIILGTRR